MAEASPLHVHIGLPKIVRVTGLETLMMNLRFAAIAPLCREAALPVLVSACIAASGVAPSATIGALTVERLAPPLTADAKLDVRLADTEPADTKPADTRLAETKPTDSRVAETKPSDTKVADIKPADIMTADTKLADTKPADIKLADASGEIVQSTVLGTAAVETVSVPPPQSAPAAAAPVANEQEPVVTAALTEPSETLRPETPPEQAAPPSATAATPADSSQTAEPIEIVDDCLIIDTCVDRYLWTLYQHAPKEDSVKTEQRRQVTIKKKHKLVTVTRSFTTVTDEDFGWKDPKAADKVGMPVRDYVIGGVDRDFKLRLFYMLHAAEAAGLSPGITSAFRDDYRQSIASGLKAADNRSYHGGSLRGGYGHGLAADVVSIKGETRAERLASTNILWNWIDAHGKDFGIGRPYLGRDPPHVAPIDGEEFVKHRGGMKTRQAAAAAKPKNKLAAQADRGAPKHARAARSSKVSSL
jgi:hypothetical protein